MSHPNIDVVRGLYEHWTRGEFSDGLERFDPDVEFIMDPDVVLGFGDHVHGIEAMGAQWGKYLNEWEGFRTGEIEDVYEADDRVVVMCTLHMRGRQSGVPIEVPEAGAIFRFREGKVSYLQLCRRETALAAAGVTG
jgi:ketosteroid isomerase-like protein